jgi:hypothetical protein
VDEEATVTCSNVLFRHWYGGNDGEKNTQYISAVGVVTDTKLENSRIQI